MDLPAFEPEIAAAMLAAATWAFGLWCRALLWLESGE